MTDLSWNILRDNLEKTKALIRSLHEDKLLYSYARDKWTIKEILLHLADDERIYAYRALRFARNDTTELPGFDQEHFARYSHANERSLKSLLQELETVRVATLSLYEYLPEKALIRAGIANGALMSVRAAAHHIAGHELKHINIIKERYL
jgi:uncharacterized damage-inducible protein DinB